MSRYLITGSAGFLGSHLAEALLKSGDEVVGIDAFTDYYARDLKETNVHRARTGPVSSLLELDLADADLTALVADVDGVFHLAAQPGYAELGGHLRRLRPGHTSSPRSACWRRPREQAYLSSKRRAPRSTGTRRRIPLSRTHRCIPSRRTA